MCKHNKIRVLWIDDCEGKPTSYLYPEKELPREFSAFFEIVRDENIPGPSTIRNPGDFSEIFSKFWSGQAKNIFPIEIIAMDYVLAEGQDTTVEATKHKDTDIPSWVLEKNKPEINQSDNSKPKTQKMKGGLFEGLIIGIFCSSMMCDYPIGVVPMTNYGNSLEDIIEVKALHSISKGLLNIDYSNFGVSGGDRSWKNVITQGVKALRYRIESLYIDGDISLSLSDLMAMYEKNGEKLTIRSKFGTRCLAVAGLFIDNKDLPENEQKEIIKDWAESLIEEIGGKVQISTLLEAEQIANELWQKYADHNDENLLEQRWTLSELAKETTGLDKDKTSKLNYLKDVFKVQNNQCTQNTLEIRDVDGNDETKRWAALFVLAKLIHLTVKAQRNFSKAVGSDAHPWIIPSITVQDWMLALFPVASSPLVLPYHKATTRKIDFTSHAWGTYLREHLSLHPKDVLDGTPYGQEIPRKSQTRHSCGLKPAEQHMLKEKILDYKDVSEEDLKSSKVAKTILYRNMIDA